MNQIAHRPYEIGIVRSPLGGDRIIVSGTDSLVNLFREYYGGLDREMVLGVVIDDINQLLGIYEISRGSSAEAPIDPVNVFRPAILLNGSKVLVVHNHPTGDLRPSEGDVRSAKALFMLASLLDLEMSDNIIINAESGEYASVHAAPEFRRWLGEDLLRIATLMSGADITAEQRSAADELVKLTSEMDNG
jgi:DNA repair protein RadC